jgi:hypothetical protein
MVKSKTSIKLSGKKKLKLERKDICKEFKETNSYMAPELLYNLPYIGE